jgi:hypothetical protein
MGISIARAGSEFFEAAHDLKKTSKNTAISPDFVAPPRVLGYKAPPSTPSKSQRFGGSVVRKQGETP